MKEPEEDSPYPGYPGQLVEIQMYLFPTLQNNETAGIWDTKSKYRAWSQSNMQLFKQFF